MSAGPGWIGDIEQVLNYLQVVGADRDANGNFKIYGEKVITGLDPNEIVIPAETEYSVNGHRKNLPAGLASTSHGVPVIVIA